MQISLCDCEVQKPRDDPNGEIAYVKNTVKIIQMKKNYKINLN